MNALRATPAPPKGGSKTFDELMAEAYKKATAYRQKMRLRHLKIRREIDNGNQKNLQSFNSHTR